MGISERRDREKKDRQYQILAATQELILEEGVESLSMQMIADRVEISKATLYLSFLNKEAILREILEAVLCDFVESVNKSIDSSMDGLAAINTLWTIHLKMFSRSENLLVIAGIVQYVYPGLLPDMSGVDSEEHRSLFLLRNLITDLVKRGVQDGSLMADVDPVNVADILIAIESSMLDQVARQPRRLRNTSRVFVILHDTFEILLRGIAADGVDHQLTRLTSSR
mgnify:CR=1 FL=1